MDNPGQENLGYYPVSDIRTVNREQQGQWESLCQLPVLENGESWGLFTVSVTIIICDDANKLGTIDFNGAIHIQWH